METETKISDLIGKTLIEVTGGVGDDEFFFRCSDGSKFKLYHQSDCCESVSIDAIDGNLNDLIDTPVTGVKEEVFDQENPAGATPKNYQDSFSGPTSQ